MERYKVRRTLGAAAFAFGISWSAVAGAQTPGGRIVGQAVDSTTGTPIPAVIVRLPSLHREELTHEDGSFRLGVPAGEHVLVAQRVGYRPVTRRITVRAGEELQVRVAMTPFVAQLAPMVVTGTVSERSPDELVTTTSVLSGASLDRQLDGTLASTIEDQPGVAMTSMGPATGRPVIRGLSGDRIVVLEDGVRAGDMSSTSGDHAVSVDPTSAKRIEVVRGPMSLLYGSSALGGVVNVVREDIPESLPEHSHGVAVLGGASVDRAAAASGTLTTRIGSFAVRGDGSYRRAGDVRTPLGTLSNTSAETHSLSGGAALIAGWGHAGGSYRYYENDYGIPGGFVGGHPGGVDILMKRHTGRGNLEWHREGRTLPRVNLTGGYSNYRHFELESSGAVGTSFRQEQVSADVITHLDSTERLGVGAFGVQARYRDIQTGGSLRTPSTDDYALAAFAVEELVLGAMRMQGGARFDYARYRPREQTTITIGGSSIPVRPRTFSALSGSVGALYTAAPSVRIGASVSRAFRTPDFNELYSDGPHLAANSYDVGDPELRAETGIGTDVFVRLTRPSLRGEIAAFYNSLDDYISPASRGRVERGTQGTVPRLQFTNADAVLRGVEGTLEWSMSSSLIAEVTASHVAARFTEARDSIPVFDGV